MIRKRNRKAESESHEALKEATEVLAQTKARSPEVHKVAQALRVLREKNHFTEKLEAIMEGRS